jgi:hypothetical protein
MVPMQWERSAVATPEIRPPDRDSNSDQMQGPFLSWPEMYRAAALWGYSHAHPVDRGGLLVDDVLATMDHVPVLKFVQRNAKTGTTMWRSCRCDLIESWRSCRDLKLASEEDAKAKKKA